MQAPSEQMKGGVNMCFWRRRKPEEEPEISAEEELEIPTAEELRKQQKFPELTKQEVYEWIEQVRTAQSIERCFWNRTISDSLRKELEDKNFEVKVRGVSNNSEPYVFLSLYPRNATSAKEKPELEKETEDVEIPTAEELLRETKVPELTKKEVLEELARKKCTGQQRVTFSGRIISGSLRKELEDKGYQVEQNEGIDIGFFVSISTRRYY